MSARHHSSFGVAELIEEGQVVVLRRHAALPAGDRACGVPGHARSWSTDVPEPFVLVAVKHEDLAGREMNGVYGGEKAMVRRS